MNDTSNSSFDVALIEARTKPAGMLRVSDVKRLLKLAGKQPSDGQVQKVSELIVASPLHQPLVFELLSESEVAQNPNPKLALLKPALVRVAHSWHGTPPPNARQLSYAQDWLQEEVATISSTPDANYARFRAVILWLLAQYRDPDFFLSCLVHLERCLAASQLSTGKRGHTKSPVKSGFVLQSVAENLRALGKGRKPKWAKISEMAVLTEAVLTHLREKSMAADAALQQLAGAEAALAEQRRLNQQYQGTIGLLESTNQNLEAEKTNLNTEIEKLGALHQRALDHAQSRISEARKAEFVRLQSRLQPKLVDVKLYLDRAQPVTDQALRLLVEIEQTLQQEEGK